MEKCLKVGHARIDITPTEPVPLTGYGNSHRRISVGVLDPLLATCVVFKDTNNNTLVLCTVDMCHLSERVWPLVVEQASVKWGIPKETIYLAATHTHSGPDYQQDLCESSGHYREFLIESLVQVIGAALTDCKNATIETASTTNEGLNFVRHYLMEDGSYAGDNFGDRKTKKVLHSVTQPDRNIQMIKIVRDGEKDILMVNWQAHPALASTGTSEYGKQNRFYVTSDYVGVTRRVVEERTGMHFAFFQGACGNISSRTYDPKESVTRNHVEYGEQLAEFIIKGLDGFRPVAASEVGAKSILYHGKTDHSEDHLLPYAEIVAEEWKNSGDYDKCKELGAPYGINTCYHAMSILRKVTMGEYLDMNLGAGKVGDIGFAFIPYEPFDTNGMYIKENSPFAMTFVLGYTNGYFNYIPSKLGFDYSCYERNQCKHERGTGEAVAEAIVDALNELHQ